MTITAEQIPGYRAGTWDIDPTHTEVSFTVRHLAISKVRGTFETFSGTIVTGENPLDSSVDATAEVASVNTNQKDRDAHLRTGDFFLADEYPQLTIKSTGLREVNGEGKLDADLTIRGITKPVTFDIDFGGFTTDPYGNYKLGLTAKTVVQREDFDLKWNAALETGGFMLGNDVTITLEVQAALRA